MRNLNYKAIRPIAKLSAGILNAINGRREIIASEAYMNLLSQFIENTKRFCRTAAQNALNIYRDTAGDARFNLWLGTAMGVIGTVSSIVAYTSAKDTVDLVATGVCLIAAIAAPTAAAMDVHSYAHLNRRLGLCHHAPG